MNSRNRYALHSYFFPAPKLGPFPFCRFHNYRRLENLCKYSLDIICKLYDICFSYFTEVHWNFNVGSGDNTPSLNICLC